jgi:hypothetical protein
MTANPLSGDPVITPDRYYRKEICNDCGVDCSPCSGRRGCRHKGRWQRYMIHNGLWEAFGVGDGFRCIPCLEKRRGGELVSEDFTGAPINQPDSWDTDLAWSRKTGLPVEARRFEELLDRLNRKYGMVNGEDDISFVIWCAEFGDRQAQAFVDSCLPARSAKTLKEL